MSERTKIIAVVGPTASGKTALGVDIALNYSGEVISCDSMQIYKNMPIASAAPTVEETKGVLHHLIGIKEAVERFSVADFIELAEEKIIDIKSRGKLPIIVGGTGLYIDSLIKGVRFSQEDSSGLRKRLESECEKVGSHVMLDRLRAVDADAAAKLHVNDRKRIIRALEMFELSGKTKTELEADSIKESGKYDTLWIGISYKDRELLYNRINKRIDLMLSNGLLEEAEQAYKGQCGKTSVQAIGHKEFFDYFDGLCSLDEAIERLKTATRHYAKRQLTWFRRNQDIKWIYADCTDSIYQSAKEIIEKEW